MRESAAARRMGFICRAVIFLCIVSAAGACFPQDRDPARGAVKARACEACHGTTDRAPLVGTPYLAGQ